MSSIVTRFAPSPTGFMHVGGVRTALYAWAWARKNGGKFILRIEDTDKAREIRGSIEHIIETLKWLGINWDEGPDIGGPHGSYVQSERLEIYKKYAKILIEKGLAYPDPYSEEKIQDLRKISEIEKRAFLYRDYRPSTFEEWDGTRPLRFKVPVVKESKWQDAVRGDLSAGPEALDDFILIKSDGYPTYNFAHIVDDLEMGVTHIMRADEFIASTPKFLSLYEALEITPPVFVTLPPILGKEGHKKLSKRDGAKDILTYREEGYLSSAIINFLAYLGWNPGDDREILSQDEFLEAFEITRIHKSGAMLDEEKLEWINKEHMKKQPPKDQIGAIKRYLPEYDEALITRMRPVIVERITHYGELLAIEKEEFAFFKNRPKYDTQKLLWKDVEPSLLQINLEHVKGLLEGYKGQWSAEALKELIFPFAEERGKGEVLWPLRVSLSGQDKSIDPFSILSILLKEESCARIDIAIDLLSSLKNTL